MNTRIKEIRTSLSLSQTEFAQKLHLTPQSISMIESGRRPVTDRLVHNLCSEFDVDENWLRTGEGDMFPPLPEEDDDLIEMLGQLSANDMDPRKKRIVSTMCRYVMSLSEDDLSRLDDLFKSLTAALDGKNSED